MRLRRKRGKKGEKGDSLRQLAVRAAQSFGGVATAGSETVGGVGPHSVGRATGVVGRDRSWASWAGKTGRSLSNLEGSSRTRPICLPSRSKLPVTFQLAVMSSSRRSDPGSTVDYSLRSACIGSTPAALRAGSHAATNAAVASRSAAAPSSAGFQGFTPTSSLAIT
jgi:hypothetical protein